MANNKISFRENIAIYLKLVKKYKWIFLVLAILSIISEASMVVDKFLFKVIIDRGTEFYDKSLELNAFTQILIIVTVVFLSVIIIRSIVRWILIHLLNTITANLIMDLKRKFFNHIIHLSYNFHTTHRTGSLISRMTRGTRAIDTMTDTVLFNMSPLILQLIIVGGSLIYFSWVPALVTLIVVVTFAAYSLIIMSMQIKSRSDSNKAEDIEKGNIGDVFANIDSIKYFGKEEYIKSKYAKLAEKTRVTSLKAWNFWRWIDFGQALILGTGLFFALYFPILDFLNNQMTLGTLVFIFTVYGNLVGPMFMFVWGVRGFYESLIDFDALFQYDKIKNDIADAPNAKILDVKEGAIEFKDISFKYRKKNIFGNFSLKVHKNEKVAIVGHSGCGKTTLVKLLYRLYDIDSGKINIDGKDIKDFKQESLRSELSVVPQECVLFDDTIYNNIIFSNPSASRADVIKAIKLAQLDSIIKKFPKKENTIVGERGVKLSGGEKQRVSIARAILANKKVLVLDEATSSLDSETEHEIQEALTQLLKGRTSIIIAHRLSTIMNADRIVVMENGKIVQIGKHAELINKKGLYKRLWNMQKGGYIKE